jgi:hypothetical protein
MKHLSFRISTGTKPDPEALPQYNLKKVSLDYVKKNKNKLKKLPDPEVLLTLV